MSERKFANTLTKNMISGAPKEKLFLHSIADMPSSTTKKPFDVFGSWEGTFFAIEYKLFGNSILNHQHEALTQVYKSGGVALIGFFGYHENIKHIKDVYFFHFNPELPDISYHKNNLLLAIPFMAGKYQPKTSWEDVFNTLTKTFGKYQAAIKPSPGDIVKILPPIQGREYLNDRDTYTGQYGFVLNIHATPGFQDLVAVQFDSKDYFFFEIDEVLKIKDKP